jgi:hypothetical protein
VRPPFTDDVRVKPTKADCITSEMACQILTKL